MDANGIRVLGLVCLFESVSVRCPQSYLKSGRRLITTRYLNLYRRSLWAQIMAVTGLAVFSGDLVVGFLVRFTGTVCGLVLGMLAWYIGNGNGSNPYGTTAALMVMIAPIVFWRLAAKPATMAFPLMMGVTVALIVGYSWVDSHLPLLVNSGIGVDVAWKRA